MRKAITAFFGLILLFLLLSCSQKPVPQCNTYSSKNQKQIRKNAHRDATGIPVRVKRPDYKRTMYDGNGVRH